jgi:hypothetical protein
MPKPSKIVTERSRLQKLFDVPERVGAIPVKLYKEISPSNPASKVPFFLALHLLDQGQLARKIVEDKPVKLRKNSTWFTCFVLLEAVGLHRGIHYRELAQHLGITPEAAKESCLKAEAQIYAIYGLHVGFFSYDGTFKLGTDREVASKHYQSGKAIRSWIRRTTMYSHIANELGDLSGVAQLELFTPRELESAHAGAQ